MDRCTSVARVAVSCTPSVTWLIAAAVSSNVAACCVLRWAISSLALRMS
jgi:hypothetical protein